MGTTRTFEAIGTVWTIDVHDQIREDACNELFGAIHTRIREYDETYSRFRDDSLLMRAGKVPGSYMFPSHSHDLFFEYRKMYDITQGKVTPLIGDVLSALGYDASYSLKVNAPVRKPFAWDDAIHYQDGTLTTHVPVIIDVGAGGKGHLIDLVGVELEEQGIGNYTIDAGGDIRYRTTHEAPLRVGLEHPRNPNEIIGYVDLLSESVCGSAGNRRAWGEYHHIIDPQTLMSPRHREAVWVLGETTFIADLLTTALFFVPPEDLISHYKFEYVILDQFGVASFSPGFPGELFTV
jgi:FAD:protein FMN transferase